MNMRAYLIVCLLDWC